MGIISSVKKIMGFGVKPDQRFVHPEDSEGNGLRQMIEKRRILEEGLKTDHSIGRLEELANLDDKINALLSKGRALQLNAASN